MPTVNGFDTSVQMGDPFNWSGLLFSVPQGGSSTSWSSVGDGVWGFTGTGFSVYSSGLPQNGTITGISYSGNGVTIAGISLTMAAFRNYVATDNLSGLLTAVFAGNDTINGSTAGDALTGYGGTNTIFGGNGDDLVQSLGVADTLDGGNGDDQVVLERNSAAGVTISLTGMDTAAGITLADGTVIRNVERFNITTGPGADTLSFAGALSGLNTYNAGAGVDRVIIDLSGTSINWSLQSDRIVAAQFGSPVLFMFGVEVFEVTGGSGSDELRGGSLNDTLSGGDGNDAIFAGAGVDIVDGGAGTDTLELDRSGAAAAITLNTADLATNTGVTLADGASIRNIEHYRIISGSGADTYNITALPPLLALGASYIDGGAGFDTLTGDFSASTTPVQSHVFWFNFESVHVTGGSGGDSLNGGSGNDELQGGVGNDELHGGGSGVDLLDGGDGSDRVTVGLTGVATDVLFTLLNFDTPTGVTFINGTIVRNAESVFILAGSGNDTLDLGTGYSGDHGFNGGAGFDTVTGNFSASSASVQLGSGFLRWQGNDLTIDADRYLINGGTNEDVLEASTTAIANDVFNGGASRDVLRGYLGDDVLNGDAGADVLFGHEGADTMNGGDGADEIYMQGGADQINGGVGIDTLVYQLPSDQLNQSQTFSATAFAGMATPTGATLANGAVVRNMEILQAQLGSANDTILVGSGSIGAVSIDAAGGLDTIQANFAGDTRQISLGINIAGGGYFSFNGQTVTFSFSNVERFVVIGGDGLDSVEAPGGDDVINGGAGNDSILGGFGADTVEGGDGDDILYGAAYSDRPANADTSSDTLRGGAGDDQVIGGAGADVLDGGAGVDLATYLTATSGVTVSLSAPNTNIGDAAGDTFISIENLFGSNFNDVLTGDTGANVLRDRGGNDILNGEGGDDRLDGEAGNDTLNGGDGDDVLVGSTQFALSGADAFNGGAGTDTVDYADEQAGVVVNLLAGTATDADLFADTLNSVENAVGSAFADTLTGDGGVNRLTGGAGNDTLNGGASADILIGGVGNDTFVVDDASDNVTEAASEGTDTVQALATFALGANVENMTLIGAAAISGFGNGLNNALTGNAAANQLNGFDGADTLDGAGGADALFGGNGDDTYIVDNAGDVTAEVSALGGTDLVLSSVARNLTAHIENLTLTGAAAITGAGNTLNNVITGNSAANTLYGFDGDDRLDGGLGADSLFGANGDDTYVVNDVNDITVEGSPSGGVDTVESSINRNLNANFENLTLTGTAQFGYGNILGNVMTGNAAANALYGFDGADTLDGGAGADQMFGANGDDTYIVDNASDVTSEVSVSGGTDTVMSSVTRNLTSNLENLVLTGDSAINGAGNALANVITGNAAANTLFGLDGADTLDGGLGADTLQGGLHADTYVFSSALGGGNVDTVNGFNVADDTIRLDSAIFTGLTPGPLDASAFHIGAAAADADDRIIYDSATGALYFDADGDGAGAAVQFATLAAGLALTTADVIVGP